MNPRKSLLTVETAIIWLFLLQSLRVLFTALFGVIYDAVFDQTLSFAVVGLDMLLVVLAMLTPLLLRRFESQAGFQVAAALLVLVARVPLSLADPNIRLYASILSLAGGAFYIAYLLRQEPERLMRGFLLGLGIEQVLRALDYTYDPTLRPSGLPLITVLALGTAFLTLYQAREHPPATQDRPRLNAGLALGAALFVQTSFLSLPNALTHWSGLSYNWAAPLLLLVTLLPLGQIARDLEIYVAIWLWPMGGLISIAALLVCLTLAAWLGGIVAAGCFLLLQFLFLLNLTTGIIKGRTSESTPGVDTALGLILFLLFNLAFAFTFTYPYTLPFFRNLGTPLLMLAILISAFPIVNTRIEPEVGGVNMTRSAFGLGGLFILAFILALLTRTPALSDTPASSETLRLATYNIHYGFDTDWVYNLEEIAETIADQAVDVVVLQEVDAGRITSLSVDDALWLGQRLDMHVVYQPTLEKTSGIALLSRYPLGSSDGQWLTSALEQTAIVHGAIETSEGPLDVYGIWLGLEPEERATQLQEALAYIDTENPVALGGDFNAIPDSPVYARLLDADLNDPFTLTGADPALTSPAINPTERIDYVWLRGLTPRKAWVSDSLASDHRMVVVEVQLNP